MISHKCSNQLEYVFSPHWAGLIYMPDLICNFQMWKLETCTIRHRRLLQISRGQQDESYSLGTLSLEVCTNPQILNWDCRCLYLDQNISKSLRLVKKNALFARSALRNTDVAAPTDLPFENIYSMAGTAAGVTLGDDWATWWQMCFLSFHSDPH